MRNLPRHRRLLCASAGREALAVIIEGFWGALQLGCELPPEKRPRVRAMLKEFVAAALAGLLDKYR
jgi:hypothetical protein